MEFRNIGYSTIYLVVQNFCGSKCWCPPNYWREETSIDHINWHYSYKLPRFSSSIFDQKTISFQFFLPNYRSSNRCKIIFSTHWFSNNRNEKAPGCWIFYLTFESFGKSLRNVKIDKGVIRLKKNESNSLGTHTHSTLKKQGLFMGLMFDILTVVHPRRRSNENVGVLSRSVDH